MRYSEILESFSNPAPYRWIEKSEKKYLAEFTVGDEGYTVTMFKTRSRKIGSDHEFEEMWIINFGLDEPSAVRIHGNKFHSMELTKLRRQFSVLGTILAIIEEFITDVRPDTIAFSDTKSLKSRSDLYQKFADYLCKKYHYRFDDALMNHFRDKDIGSIWILRRDEPLLGVKPQ